MLRASKRQQSLDIFELVLFLSCHHSLTHPPFIRLQ
jgi:hypothetical protein